MTAIATAMTAPSRMTRAADVRMVHATSLGRRPDGSVTNPAGRYRLPRPEERTRGHEAGVAAACLGDGACAADAVAGARRRVRADLRHGVGAGPGPAPGLPRARQRAAACGAVRRGRQPARRGVPGLLLQKLAAGRRRRGRRVGRGRPGWPAGHWPRGWWRCRSTCGALRRRARGDRALAGAAGVRRAPVRDHRRPARPREGPAPARAAGAVAAREPQRGRRACLRRRPARVRAAAWRSAAPTWCWWRCPWPRTPRGWCPVSCTRRTPPRPLSEPGSSRCTTRVPSPGRSPP